MPGFFRAFDAYRGGRGSDLSFWLTVNSGASIKVDRKGNNRESYTIARPCIAIIGGLTPSDLGDLTAPGRDNGWLDRFLLSYPDTTVKPRRVEVAGRPDGSAPRMGAGDPIPLGSPARTLTVRPSGPD